MCTDFWKEVIGMKLIQLPVELWQKIQFSGY